MVRRPRRSRTVVSVAGVSVAAAAVAVAGVSGALASPGSPASAGTRIATAPASASSGRHVPLHVATLTTKVVAPLQMSVTKKYGVLVGDAAASKLLQIVRGGNVRTLAKGPQPGEISGVDVNRWGAVAYTSSNATTHTTGLTIRWRGKSRFVDLSAFETKKNPDKINHYGTTSTDACVTGFLKQTGTPASYTGVVDSHPYAVAAVRGGWVVAEAAGNDLLFVDNRGHVKLLAVLPPQPHVITAADAKALGAPSCVVGITYAFEPVPTDVEVGRDGALYVTTLPGGPEAPGFSPRGSVYRVSANGHHLRRLATGFNGATNLALTPSGRILVAELFAGRISTIEHGRPAPVLKLDRVASLEFFRHAVFAGQNAPTDANGDPTGHGKVVRITVRW